MKVYIGIDDTDNLESRGTGFIARSLAKQLEEQDLGIPLGITRHQLLVDPAIPYTSHNSSLCILWESNQSNLTKVISFSCHFLRDKAAPGSDPGLCIAIAEQITEEIKTFGYHAKTKVLTKAEAVCLAEATQVHWSEHGGTGGGVIGALAGIGLSCGGNDGRFIWLKGIREMVGIFSAEEILLKSGVHSIQSTSEDVIQKEDLIDVGDWFRPVLIDHQPMLLVEKSINQSKAKWCILDKTIIKARP